MPRSWISRVACAALVASGVFGQTPAFDAASVKPNRSSDPPSSLFPLGPGDAFVPGSLFSARNQPLIAYLRFAYKLGQSDLQGLPDWVYSDGYDIEARAPGNPTKDQMRSMMRSLLAERFKVRTHTEQQSKRVYELVLAKPGNTGPQLQPHSQDAGCSGPPPLKLPPIACGKLGPIPANAPNRGRLGGRGVTLAQIAAILMNPFTGVDRPVIDAAGLSGTFDFSVEWSPDPDQPDAGPGFLEALQKQLGLRLQSASAPVEVLVVDRVERPDAN